MSFRQKNENFVPDKRCSGWWAANVVEFIGPSGRKLISCSKVEVDETLNNNLKNLLDVYCRYRIYAHESGLLMMSVREEDVNHVCDALYNFRLERPKPEHFLCTTIGSERAPYFREMLPEIRDLLHNYNLKNILSSESTDPEKIIKKNYVTDMVNVLTDRILIDYPEQDKCDNFIRSMCSQLLSFPCRCRKECIWHCYKNIWDFQELLDKKGKRSSEERERVFGKFYSMTEKELGKRLRVNSQNFINEIGGSVNPFEKHAGLHLPVLPDVTDNQPLRNADVHYGRGLYLSHSTTYANYDKNAKPAEDDDEADKAEEVESSEETKKSGLVSMEVINPNRKVIQAKRRFGTALSERLRMRKCKNP